jgi:hypothetical protein
MLGRDLRLPVDLLYGRPDQEPSRSTSAYSDNLEARLEQIQEFARDHLKIASDRMKERYDSSVDGALLERGDPVWLYNPQRKKGKSPKLTRPWKGPYLVIKRINDVVYRVQLSPRSKPKVVHRNRLWKYSGISTPDWLDRGNSPTPDREEPPVNDVSHTTSPAILPDAALPLSPEPEGSFPRRSRRRRHSPDRLHYRNFWYLHGTAELKRRGSSVMGRTNTRTMSYLCMLIRSHICFVLLVLCQSYRPFIKGP